MAPEAGEGAGRGAGKRSGETARERGRDLDRLLTFIDAIVAIAITLLVLPLVELVSELDDHGGVADLLRAHVEELWSFVLSFFVIARLWLIQHRAVAPLLVANGRLTLLLVGWSFTIVVLPFATSLVAGAGDEAITKVLYVATMTLGILLVTAARSEIGRHPELSDGGPYEGPRGGLVSAGLLVLALVLMLAVPALSYLPILLLAADGPVERVLTARNRRAT